MYSASTPCMCKIPSTCGRRSIVLLASLPLLQPFLRSKLQQVKSEFKEMRLGQEINIIIAINFIVSNTRFYFEKKV